VDIIQDLISRAPRYGLASDDEIEVRVERDSESGLESTEAELIDISPGGAKLRTAGPLNVLDILSLQLCIKRLHRTITVAGAVCWTTPTTNGQWWVGCRFKPPMPEQTLQEFAQDGILERRKHERDQTWLRMTAKFELKQELASVWVLNFSKGGFCILSDTQARVGERAELRIDLDNNRSLAVRGKVCWQVESSEGYVVGCEMLRNKDFGLLMDIHESRSPQQHGGFHPLRWIFRLLEK